MQVQSLGQEDPLEKGMAIHSSILAWRIPWTKEHGGLQSMGSQSQTQMKQQLSNNNNSDLGGAYKEWKPQQKCDEEFPVKGLDRHPTSQPECSPLARAQLSPCPFLPRGGELCCGDPISKAALGTLAGLLQHIPGHCGEISDFFFNYYFWLCWVFIASWAFL